MSMMMDRVVMMMENNPIQVIRRADLWIVDLTGAYGSVQGGKRGAIVYQNDLGNKFSPCTIIIPLTTKKLNKKLPTHVQLLKGVDGVIEDSTALTEQIMVVDKYCLLHKVGQISDEKMKEIDKAHLVSIGLSHLVGI